MAMSEILTHAKALDLMRRGHVVVDLGKGDYYYLDEGRIIRKADDGVEPLSHDVVDFLGTQLGLLANDYDLDFRQALDILLAGGKVQRETNPLEYYVIENGELLKVRICSGWKTSANLEGRDLLTKWREYP